MPTARIVPSSYSRSNTSYVTVSNVSNMYNNTDNTSGYATFRGRAGNYTQPFYAFINGFDFSSIPSNAVVSSFAVKIKAYKNGSQRTGYNETYDYRPKLASYPSDGNVISGTELTTDLTTSAAVYTLPNGTLAWSDIRGYGSNFSIEIPLSSSSGAYPYVHVYGAEIEVTYTEPEPPAGDTIFVKVNGSWVESENVYAKVNGTWQLVGKAYKKENGAWEEKDKSAMFDPNALYIDGNTMPS